MTRILMHCNAPNVKTGYGVQCAYLVERLAADSHDVAVSATYGQQASMAKWKGIDIYPTGYEVNGNDILHNHALHFFRGDARGGWIIPLLDVWALINPLLAEFNVAAWAPVDHYPIPRDVLRFFHRTGAVPIAMSRFGEALFAEAGLDPVYIPLAVDTKVYKPTQTIKLGDQEVTGREFIGVPEDAFVVGMVAMNKGWSRDRKGFNEALRAFAAFWQNHQDAVLYMHCDAPGGAEGIDLEELALHAGIPEHAIVWVDQYAYRFGHQPEHMAAVYSAMDVLLAPSHGEGFGVPLIEAQACGTPVIASNFSAQRELASPEYGAAGWVVQGQPEWDPAQHASYIVPFIGDIVDKLEQAYAADRVALAERAVAFASQYDADNIYVNYWKPFLATLEPPVPVQRELMTDVAVVVPLMRTENLPRLLGSFDATNDGTATLYLIHDTELFPASGEHPKILTGLVSTTYAEKVNIGVAETTESFVCVVGDDVEFKPGWLDAARRMSDRFDVIGTNDTEGAPRNPDVAAGRHADHFFVRRSYIEDDGASLEGPGILAPEVYGHWFTDKEVIELAKARGVFTPCLESVVVHHHPGYDGREDLRQADPVYMRAVETSEADEKTWRSRLPLIAQQRVTRAKPR
jgi:glycosyltransferase involved in cell wall biosynthesis